MTIVYDDRSKNTAKDCYICRNPTTSLENRLRINGSDRQICNTCFVRYKNEANNRNSIKVCVECGMTKTSMEEIKWVKSNGQVGRKVVAHWYGTIDKPLCKICYVRRRWQELHVPKDAKCDRCGRGPSVFSKYGTPIWVRVRDRNGNDAYMCKPCFVIVRDTGQQRPQEARKNIGIGIRRAVDKGVIFGRTTYTLDQTVFDRITEDSAYWTGDLMSDGNISLGKTGNPRIVLTLAKVAYDHLVKFKEFLKCTNPILPKKKKYHGAIVIQCYLRFSSRHIAEILYSRGVVPQKSLIAKVIGLENNRHFWRGVFDGDGYFKNKDGKDGDRMVLTGSNDLCAQFEEFIIKNVPNARVTIKKVREYSKLYIYSDTARAVAYLLYSDCKIALQRKLLKARKMFGVWQ